MTEKLRIKICGMRDRDNVADVAALHPDFMGFIFYPPIWHQLLYNPVCTVINISYPFDAPWCQYAV